jgi:hypothetical protein
MHRIAVLSLLIIAKVLPAAEVDGATIYQRKCANCHGPQGEGAKKYPKPLVGERSVAQLAKLIWETMPESNPGSLTEAEAQAVATYIHGAFYSPLARERNRPARIELSRLTVRQYRMALADLVGSFRSPMNWEGSGGLNAQYFSGRRMAGKPTEERRDPVIFFDFKTDSPFPGKMEAHEFSIRWTGSVLAPETGEYEFVVRTDHAARLWVNDGQHPLIDAWVKSGNDTEFRASRYLIGGRAYPLRLDFSKAKQGVDDSKKQKKPPPPKPAFISLWWKVPGRALEVIPATQLSIRTSPESYVCSVPFPPDDRSYGWERGTNVSKEWEAATTEGALDVAGYVAAHIEELSGIRIVERPLKPNSGDPSGINLDEVTGSAIAPEHLPKLRAFAKSFAERAWRRPLTPEQQKLIDRQFEGAKDIEIAVKRVVLLTLKSPRFLYRELTGGNDPFDVAERLSFSLWDSLPDAELWQAASSGQLVTREMVEQQARRMLNDVRAKAKLRRAVLTWARADHGLDLAKDPMRFPGFSPEIISDLRRSLEQFVDEVLDSPTSDFRRLLLDDEIPLNRRLAQFYGLEPLPNDDLHFQRVRMDAGHRAGILTHPYLMASFAHSAESSPIHRGVFLARGVLGVSLRPPPEAVAPLSPDLHPNLTTRERVEMQTRPNACMTCHGIINPLGFTLEHFDAVGRYRHQDRGKPINAQGTYLTRDGRTVTVRGARQLAEFLAASSEAHDAFVEQTFHQLTHQAVRAYGANTLNELRQSFVAKGFNIRELAIEIMARTALLGRTQQAAAARAP